MGSVERYLSEYIASILLLIRADTGQLSAFMGHAPYFIRFKINLSTFIKTKLRPALK